MALVGRFPSLMGRFLELALRGHLSSENSLGTAH